MPAIFSWHWGSVWAIPARLEFGIRIVVVLLPSLIYRMKVEERLLTRYFGMAYRQYADEVKGIIPGIW